MFQLLQNLCTWFTGLAKCNLHHLKTLGILYRPIESSCFMRVKQRLWCDRWGQDFARFWFSKKTVKQTSLKQFSNIHPETKKSYFGRLGILHTIFYTIFNFVNYNDHVANLQLFDHPVKQLTWVTLTASVSRHCHCQPGV